MALAVVLEAPALLAVAAPPVSRTPPREELLPVAAGEALAGRRAGHSLLEALAVVLHASRLGTGAFPDGFCLGRMLMGRGRKICVGHGGWRGRVVVEEGRFFAVGGLVEEELIEVEVGMGM